MSDCKTPSVSNDSLMEISVDRSGALDLPIRSLPCYESGRSIDYLPSSDDSYGKDSTAKTAEPLIGSKSVIVQPEASRSNNPRAPTGSWFRSIFQGSEKTYHEMLEPIRMDLKKIQLFSYPESPLLGERSGPSFGSGMSTSTMPVMPRKLAHSLTISKTLSPEFQRKESSLHEVKSSQGPSSTSTNTLPENLTMLSHFKVNGGPILYFFTHPVLFDLIVVTKTTIESFSWDGGKILEVRLAVTWAHAKRQDGLDDPDDEKEALDDYPPNLERKVGAFRSSHAIVLTHLGGEGNAKVIPATCATYLPPLDEVAVGHEDGVIRFYSTRTGSMGSVLREAAVSVSVPSAMTVLDSSRLLVGYQDGFIRIWRSKILNKYMKEVPPPESCLVVNSSSKEPVGVVSQHLLASPYAEGALSLCVSYSNGVVRVQDLAESPFGLPEVSFWAHVSGASAAAHVLRGTCIASIGLDNSLVITSSSFGTCLYRKLLDYTPTAISTFHPKARDMDGPPNPSECAVLIGGSEGQVELFRIAPLSSQVVEVRKVRTISERSRVRDSGITELQYDSNDAILTVGTKNGFLRRWRFSVDEAFVVAPLEMGMEGNHDDEASDPRRANDFRSQITEFNVAEQLDVEIDPTKFSSWKSVIAAQRCLATSMSKGIDLEDNAKDSLVAQFQEIFLESREILLQLDSELRNSFQTIRNRYRATLYPSSDHSRSDPRFGIPVYGQIQETFSGCGRLAAAFEALHAMRRHYRALCSVRDVSRERFRQIILSHLRLGRGDAQLIDAATRDVESL